MNTKLTQDRLYAALDLISKGVVRPTQIAIALDISYRTLCQWMLRSNRDPDDPDFLVVVGGETMSWARAISQAKRLFYLELRGAVESYSLLGRDEVLFKDAQVVWAIDPAAAAIDDPDIRELLGYRRDALVEIDGKLQPVTAHRDAPIALVMRVLETGFRDWKPGTTSEVTLNGGVSIGIVHRPKADYSGPPPPALPEPAIPQIEDQSGSEVLSEAIEDISEGDFTDAEFEETEAPAVIAPEPEPVIDPRYGAMSPSQREILARLRAGSKVI
jgi:hypothetical protein